MVTIRTARFNIQQFYVLPTQCIYVFRVDLRTNSDYFPIQHWLTDFYNRDGVCLLRGTDWVFIYKCLGPHGVYCYNDGRLWVLYRVLYLDEICALLVCYAACVIVMYRCVTTQKNTDLIYNTAEAWNPSWCPLMWPILMFRRMYCLHLHGDNLAQADAEVTGNNKVWTTDCPKSHLNDTAK